MLVLSRKEQESLVIGEGVTVRVLEIRGRYVRLGIEAPPEVRIQRREIIVERQEPAARPGMAPRLGPFRPESQTATVAGSGAENDCAEDSQAA